MIYPQKEKENVDASNYPEVHSSSIETEANKKVLGMF